MNFNRTVEKIFEFFVSDWTQLNSIGILRCLHSAILLDNGHVLVVGGSNGGQALNSVEIFDVVSQTWNITPCFQHTASSLRDGQILVMRGEHNLTSLNSVERYDPQTRTWTLMNPMVVAPSRHAAVVLTDERILVIGGYQNGSALYSVEVFNPWTGNWSLI